MLVELWSNFLSECRGSVVGMFESGCGDILFDELSGVIESTLAPLLFHFRVRFFLGGRNIDGNRYRHDQ